MKHILYYFILTSAFACAPLIAQRKFNNTQKPIRDFEFNLKDLVPIKTFDFQLKELTPAKAFSHIKDLSPETLLTYLPPVPQVLKQTIDNWRRQFYTKNKFDILEKLNEISSFKSDYEDKIKLLKKYKINYKESAGNFIIPVPGTNFLIKIAGTSNKRFNYAANDWTNMMNPINNKIGPKLSKDPNSEEFKKGLEEWYALWQDIYTKYKQNPVPFYQTVSRAERYMLIQKAMDFHKIKNIKLPKLYLVPFNDKITSPVSDETYFVIEEAPGKDIEMITKENFKNIPPETIKDLLMVCKEGYLWNVPFGDKIGLAPDKKTLILYDLEQPNRFSTNGAFLKDRSNYELFALQGIGLIIQAIKDYGTKAQLDAASEFIKKDEAWTTEPKIEEFHGYSGYKSKIDLQKK